MNRAILGLCLACVFAGIVIDRYLVDALLDWLADVIGLAYEWGRRIVLVVGLLVIIAAIIWAATGDLPSLPSDPGPSV